MICAQGVLQDLCRSDWILSVYGYASTNLAMDIAGL